MCVAVFNVPPGNKDAVASNPLTKEETVYNGDDEDQLNTGVSKVCEIFKVHGIESLKYVRVVIVVTFPRPET